MNAKRRTVTPDNLPGRVYPKNGAWYWVPVIDGKLKWIRLCAFAEGETRMLDRLAEEKRKVEDGAYTGDVPVRVKEYMAEVGPTRADTWRVEWERQGEAVKTYFREWNVDQIDPAAVIDFLRDNWPDKIPTQRSMRAWLSGFFGWCILRRHASANPCKEVKLKKPAKRKVYIPDAHFVAIREKLLIGDDGKRTPTGDMMQCFVDLCYLTVQRSTDVRLLPRANIDDAMIHFVPSKTEDSSGEAVDWPITAEIRAVLDRAKLLEPLSEYVIRDKDGQPKTAKAVRDAWNDAKRRAGLKDLPYTVKDIRAKALTDAEKAGYSKEELRIAAAHTTAETTEIYLKNKQVPVSSVRLALPAKK
jgi:hypothetical protein